MSEFDQMMNQTSWKKRQCTYGDAFEFLLGDLRKRKPGNLVNVHLCDPASTESPTEQLSRFGYAGWTPLAWVQSGEQSYKNPRAGRDGAEVIFASPDSGSPKPIMFVRVSQDRTDSVARAMAMAAVYHELGHIDDFVNGLNMRLGQPWDMVAAEAHAHCFAMERLMNGGHRLASFVYISQVADMPARHAGTAYAEGAAAALKSLEAIKSRAWLNCVQPGMGDHAFRLATSPR